MTDAAETATRTEIVVEVGRDRAFAVFTDDIGTWWNADHHIIEAPFDHMVLEPRVGGHLYDVGTDGSECRWSRVLVFDRPDRIVLTWDITPTWQLETDPARCSEIEVRFVALTEHRTRVELEHRHLDRHGEGWQDMARAMESAGGWAGELATYGATVHG